MPDQTNSPPYDSQNLQRTQGAQTAPAQQWLGRQLGHYRLVQLIGRGGFADVYLGEHVHLGTQAAIKLLRAQLVGMDEAKFRKEARLLAELQHPNIVSIMDYGIEDGMPYLVMQYATQGTPRQRHPRGTLVPPEQVLGYLADVAEALQYAHDQGIVHRDIKPENMLIGPRNEILLSDFGIAVTARDTLIAQATFSHAAELDPATGKHAEYTYQADQTQNIQQPPYSTHPMPASQVPQSPQPPQPQPRPAVHDFAGTAMYMAPEQMRGKPVPASDQYALAVVVYEWLCGRPPFQGSLYELIAQHLSADPPSLRDQLRNTQNSYNMQPNPLNQRAELISPALEDVVLLALAKSPAQRFPTCSDFAGAFARALHPSYSQPGHAFPRAIAQPASSTLLAPLTRQEQRADPPRKRTRRHLSRRVLLTVLLGSAAGAGGLAALLRLNVHQGQGLSNGASGTTSNGNSSKSGIFGSAEQGKLYEYRQFTNTVSSVSWSPQGVLIASGCYDNTVVVWNPYANTDIYTFQGHLDQVASVAWSPDGRLIASGSNDKTLRVWVTTQVGLPKLLN